MRSVVERVAVAGLIAMSLLLSKPASAQEAAAPGDQAPTAKVKDSKGAATPSAASRATINYWDPVEVMDRGGYLMWPILFCSIAAFTFALERLISLRRGRVIPFWFVRGFMQRLRKKELDRAAAIELCQKNRSPMATILHATVIHWGRPAVEIEQAIRDTGQREISLLRRNLRAIQASGNIATLLGLLGTVFGMIEAFNKVAVYKGHDKAEVLAGGIGQALLTTAAGLAVAIPALVLYNYFAGRVERLVFDMDRLATNVIGEISAEAIAAAAITPATTAPAKQATKVKPAAQPN